MNIRPLTDEALDTIKTVLDRNTPAYLVLVQDTEGSGFRYSASGPVPNILGMVEIIRRDLANTLEEEDDA